MRPYLSLEHPIRFAHRGSRVLWPENTMVAFQGAVDLGYRYIETDVHLSRDGRVVVFHDDGLERLTDGKGKVWEHDWEDLRHLDAGHRFDERRGFPRRGEGIGIPSLEEALTTFPAVHFNLDLKQARMESALVAEIDRLAAHDRVLVGSFYDGRVRAFRSSSHGMVATAAGPREVLAALTAVRTGRSVAVAADAFQVPVRGGPMRILTPRFVAAAHRAGLHVHAWTINDPAEMRALLAMGVDGIVSDRPDLLNEAVGPPGDAPGESG